MNFWVKVLSEKFLKPKKLIITNGAKERSLMPKEKTYAIKIMSLKHILARP
jgi:hypothetical protein